ncbi:MAG: GDSL family lipase, partial [Lachnospiraceae bacterium]|nr:GDSL family lipase [Lachnospiraceae bacterium]
MGQDLCPAVEDTVNRYKTETGDNEVYYLKLDQQGSEVVVDWHPTEASHEHAADQVSEFIKSILKQ